LPTYPFAPEYKKQKNLKELTDIVDTRSKLITQIANLNLLKLLSFKLSFEKYLEENKKYKWLNKHKSLKYAASFFHFIRTNLAYATEIIHQMDQAQMKIQQEKARKTETGVNVKTKTEAEAVFFALENIRKIYVEMKEKHIRGFVKENIKAILHAFDCYQDDSMDKMRDIMKDISRVDVTQRLHSPI